MSYREGLPQNWLIKPLEAVANVIQGQSPPGDTYNTEQQGLPFFQGKTEFGPTHPVAVKWCTDPAKIAQPDDVLISIRAPVGPTNLTNTKCCIGRGLAAIRPFGNIPSRYLYYYIQHSVATLKEGATGSTFEAISGKQLRAHLVNIPPVAEQHRIVEAIESYFTRLTEAVANLERVQRNLKRYRTSILKAAVEGRLVPTEAELVRVDGRDYEPASVLLERILVERRQRWEEAGGRGKYAEPITPDAIDLPELPEGWCWAPVEMLYWDASYGTSQKCAPDAHGPPVLRIPNVQNSTVRLDDLKYATSIKGLNPQGVVAPGDFLFIRTNGSRALIGRGAVILHDLPDQFHFASYLIRLRIVQMGVLPNWFGLVWHSPVLRDQLLVDAVSSAGQHNVSLGAASKYVIPLPPLSEQKRIMTEFDRLMSLEEVIQLAAYNSVARCTRLRKSVLKWAFEGKLVDQDPTDEPAAMLIERIHAERQAATTLEQGRPAYGRRQKSRKT